MPRRLLIVDDSPVMRAFVRRCIAMAGLPVSSCIEASDGAEALALLHTSRVDLILTDINMPVMDGETMIRNVSDDASLRSIPVVVVSTDSTHHRVESLLALGAAGFIRKPFTPEELAGVLTGIAPGWRFESDGVQAGEVGNAGF